MNRPLLLVLLTLAAAAATATPPARVPLPPEVQQALADRQQRRETARLVGRVIRVIDGDSLVVRLQSGPIEVRLSGADAPEYDQPGGPEAKRALAARLRRGSEVSLEPVEQDRYDRLIAVVHRGDEVLEEYLLRQGHAWAYRRYVTDVRYCDLEDEARAHRRGLWARSVTARVAPWDWRRHGREPGFVPPDRSGESLRTCVAALRRTPPE